MSAASWAQFIVLAALVCATAPVIGWYMALVYGDGRKAPFHTDTGHEGTLPVRVAVAVFHRRVSEHIHRFARSDP